jgi:hypothetical protein
MEMPQLFLADQSWFNWGMKERAVAMVRMLFSREYF